MGSLRKWHFLQTWVCHLALYRLGVLLQVQNQLLTFASAVLVKNMMDYDVAIRQLIRRQYIRYHWWASNFHSLDTSLGAAKSPAVGNIFLSTVDASGSSKDTRSRLRRGDLIRVGHPESGETYCVSTDSDQEFTNRVIPLSSKDGARTPASLSSELLEHSTYEIQALYVKDQAWIL